MMKTRELSAALAAPPSVEELTLWNDASVKQLPDELAACTNLKTLKLGYLPIDRLPEWIGTLPALEELTLGLNQIDRIPSLRGCPRLRALELVFCSKVTALPDGIEATLERLKLQYTPIARLPDALPALRELRAENHGLTEIPAALRRSTKLEVLALGGNLIEELPPWIAELASLRAILLDNNPLRAIPDALFSLTALEELDLQSACRSLAEVPAGLRGLRRLRLLRLGQHELASIPDWLGELDGLEVLDLSSNPIRALPDSLGALRKLRQLRLRLTLVRRLPSTIGALSALEELDLADCPLEALPPELGQLPSLRILEIGTTLSPGTGGYEQGYGRRDELRLPPLRLPRLERLGADRAGLRALPDDLSGLPSLRWLSLSRNQLRELPESLYALPNLKTLWLDENVFTVEAKARLDAWTVARELGRSDVRMPHVETERGLPQAVVSRAPLDEAVQSELRRLGGVLDRKGAPSAAEPETITIRGVAHAVPEAIRALLSDVAFPSGVALAGEVNGFDVWLRYSPRPVDLSEYPCSFAHPLVSIGYDRDAQVYWAVDLSDAHPEDPTVFYISHDSTEHDALSFGRLSAFLRRLRPVGG